jgi:hypothetical protein
MGFLFELSNLNQQRKATMNQLKPKAWHEQFLANADKEKILQSLQNGQEQEITKLATSLARQSALFIDFANLWKMRVSELDVRLNSERYMRQIYVGRRAQPKGPSPEEVN